MIVAGIDEAGYGPLLGPLVVSSTAFFVPWEGELPQDVTTIPCCWKLLSAAVGKKIPLKKGRLLIADSKVVHALSEGPRLLERGVLAFARQVSSVSTNAPGFRFWIDAWGCDIASIEAHEWYHGTLARGIPLWCDAGDLAIAVNMLAAALGKSGVRCESMRTAAIPEHRFNQLVERTHNKAAALISITMTHVYELHQRFGEHGLVIGVDKQGGRNTYTDLLLRYFPDARLKVLEEGDRASVYRLDEGAKQTVVHFREKGETHFLPTALASMMCKYVREALMEGFNAWWCQRIDGLKPTAGYYLDGTRWLGDVDAHLNRLGVDRARLVRCR